MYWRNLALMASVSLFSLCSAEADAQQSTGNPSVSAASTDMDDAQVADIVVTGFRAAEASEVAAKRNSIEITDGISSDDLGRIPDLNIGEAMQRIPGIQINRDGEGREASVSLRGLPGEYARTTLNGVSFAEPILQGATPFGAYLSDVFSGVRVEKSQLAHSIAGGLSGNIDLQIAPALSRKDGFKIKAAIDYNELGDLKEPNFSVGANRHITDNFAVFGTFAYKRENFRRDSVFFNAYGTLTSALVGNANFAQYLDYYAPAGTCATVNAGVAGCQAATGGRGTKALTGVQYVNQTRQYMRLTKGDQYSASGGMEWKLGDKWRAGVVGLYTNRNQGDTKQTFQTLNFSGTGAVITPTSPVREGAGGTYFVENFDFSNVNNITDSRILPVVQRAWGLNGTIDFDDETWKLKTTGTYSKSFSSTREMYVSLSKTPQAGVSNGITGSLITGAGNWDNYRLLLNDFTVGTLDPKIAWASLPGATLTSASNYYDSPAGTPGRTTFRITGTQAQASTRLMALQQDAERKLYGSFLSSLRVGVRYEKNKYSTAGSKVSGIGINPSAINNSYLATNPDFSGFFD
ncbi:TonB-dependent receptor plug domain-containing protein [Sphingomonas sp.]|uniref:TonB-dependent receptor plug domain-containing protein n=1 Tax=Sphingomonas sp. TaxID=28214 RepID=UPI000DAFE535|nr:TonB-dependent receptor plug domain-containing protein [Sphingomonas sp.]PZU08262.1 MAG: hypothetical protein DI605_13610 [Sphingomonas sp.]